MKKNNYIIYIILLFSLQIKAQVGINTNTPNISSVLDVNSSSKGVLLPQYDLTVLNSISTPIANPADGLIIYNKGGASTYPKGHYIWIKDQWQRVVTVGSEPQNMVLTDITTSGTNILIPVNSTNNALSNFTVATNKITGASLAADKSTITLPAGTYILRYSVDGGFGSENTGPANTQYLSHNLTCIRSYIVNASTNIAITEQNKTCLLSDTFLFFQGSFFLTLATPTTIKQKFEFDTGNGFTRSSITIRSSFSLAITRMAQ